MKTETLHAMFVVWTHLIAGPRVKSNTLVVQEDFLDSDSYNNVCLSVCLCALSHGWLFATPRTTALQAPLSALGSWRIKTCWDWQAWHQSYVGKESHLLVDLAWR